ncbi:MAG TPA: DNA alkylation repair protein [Bacteroidota bacterium]|nr:DNA alkylation repair protein [Bacteroidota bacterium]
MPSSDRIARKLVDNLTKVTYGEILAKLKSLRNEKNIAGMARFGIHSEKVFGISAPVLKTMAREIGRHHDLALALWKSGYLEARILAALIDEPEKVTQAQMERWVRDFDNWAVCDTCCGSLFDKTPYAWKKALAWSNRSEEFTKRAGFALMAWLAVHDKEASDKKYQRFFSVIKRESTDDRNFVKKAVNWALRQIGKRNRRLNKKAIQVAKEIQAINSKSARWIAADALRELTNPKVAERLKR